MNDKCYTFDDRHSFKITYNDNVWYFEKYYRNVFIFILFLYETNERKTSFITLNDLKKLLESYYEQLTSSYSNW